MSAPATRRSLAGRTVLLTRTTEDNAALRRQLEALGVAVLEQPSIRIEPPETWADLDAALHDLAGGRFDWLACTSRRAAMAVIARWRGMDLIWPTNLRVGAVGGGTASVFEQHGLRVDCVPREANAAALVRAMAFEDLADTRVLVPVGNLAREEVTIGLTEAGALVHAVIVYRTLSVERLDPRVEEALQHSVDCVVFASPSAVGSLTSLVGPATMRNSSIVCIGPTTARAIHALGLEVAQVATRQSDNGLLEAIVAGLTESV